MPIRHVVAQGECLSGIARDFGFADWRALFDDPLNADLKKKRPNPNVLFPGDVVVIPDKKPKIFAAPTGKKHTIIIKREAPKLRLRLVGPDGEAFASRPYTLDMGGAKREGTTGGDGLVEEPVPQGTTDAVLTLQIDDEDPPHKIEYRLKVGHLDPVDEVSGLQARLRNLGFDPGPVDGIFGPLTQDGVLAFQRRNGLDPTGEADDATLQALTKAHDEGGS